MGPKGWEDGGSWLGQRKTEQQSKWVFVVWGFFSSPWAACSEALQKSKFMHGNGRVFILISFLGTDLCINAKMQMKLPTGFKERRKDGWVLQWVFCGFFFRFLVFVFVFILNHLEKLMCSNLPTQNAGTPASWSLWEIKSSLNLLTVLCCLSRQKS